MTSCSCARRPAIVVVAAVAALVGTATTAATPAARRALGRNSKKRVVAKWIARSARLEQAAVGCVGGGTAATRKGDCVPLAPIFENPDPHATWPSKRNWTQQVSSRWTRPLTNALCTGVRRSRDVIVYLGQKTHSSYDATHRNTLNASMASLRANMRRVHEADVAVFHEGDLGPSDANALQGATQVRFCVLRKETGWGRPPWLKTMPPSPFSAGYRYMIRFYAVTLWPTLQRLGYEWVMRMDDDSFFLSAVQYNIFDNMRRRGKLYAYRTLSRECPTIFGDFIEDFVDFAGGKGILAAGAEGSMNSWPPPGGGPGRRLAASERRLARPAGPRGPRRRQRKAHYDPWYCRGPGRLGFYNNWFVTKVSWWLEEPRVAAMIGAFDRSNLIFTRRSNDLIFQTAAVKLFMPKERRTRYTDFSYQHHTVINGAVLYGGVESGWRDRDARRTLEKYARDHVGAHRVGAENWTTSQLTLRRCSVQDDVGGEFRPTLYVAPPFDATHAHGLPPPNFMAPFCGRHHWMGME